MNEQLAETLSIAVANGRTDIVRSITSACQSPVELPDNVSVEKLINNSTTFCGTLLHLATKLDHVDIVRTLLSAGADPGIQNSMGETPLDMIATERMTAVYSEELLKATAQSDLERISQLIDAGVSVNVQDCPNSGNTPLHWAACFGNKETIDLLLGRGADVNIINSLGATPLHDAVERADLQIVEKLIKAGGNVFVKARKGKFAEKTPFDLACDNPKMMTLMKSHLFNSEQETNIEQRCNSQESVSSGNDILSPSISRLSIMSSDSPLKQELGDVPYSYASKLSTATTPLPIITDTQLHLLWPLPQKIIQLKNNNNILTEELIVNIIHSPNDVAMDEIIDLWKVFAPSIENAGYKLHIEGFLPINCLCENIVCHINSSLFTKKESYRIIVSPVQIRLLASDIRGLHYSICTFIQLLRLYSREEGIPSMCIDDWPSVSFRGVLIDMSAEARIPTLDTMDGYIKALSCLKVNEIYYYIKLTAKTDWHAPYNKRQLLELGKMCRRHFINLVPAVDVNDTITFQELLELSVSMQNFLVCFDHLEKIYIGQAFVRLILESNCKKFDLRNLWKILSISPSIMLYICSNGFLSQSEVLTNLPLNVVLVVYGHQAEDDYHNPCKIISQAGISCCVCPTTAAWNSLSGCPEAAINNIYHAIQASSCYSSMSLIVADWGSGVYHTPLCFTLPAIVVGTGLAWNPSVHWDYINSRLSELLNCHIILDSENTIGQILLELGRIETYLLRVSRNQEEHDMSNLPEPLGSITHQLLNKTDNVDLENLSIDTFQRVIRYVKHCQRKLQSAKPQCPQNGEIIAEIQLSTELMLFACRLGKLLVSIGRNPDETMGLTVINVGLVNLPPTSRTDLANKLLALTEQYRAVWLSRNLPPGLHKSLLLFNTILNKLVPENLETPQENNYSVTTAISI